MIRETWQRLSRRERFALVVGILALVAAGMDRWVVTPLAAHMDGLDRRVEEAEAAIHRNRRILHLREHADAEYARYRTYLEDEGSDEEILARVHSEIERTARDTRVRLVMVKSRAPANRKIFRDYTVDVEVEGDLEGVIRFLWRLGDSPRLLAVMDLRMHRAEDETGLCKASLTISRLLARDA